MGPDEATHIYDELHTVLGESGLGWVSAQVRQEVASGKATRKTISVFGEEVSLNIPSRRQRVEFLSTLSYSPQEQLKLLIDAIEQAVVGTAEMQRSTLKMVSDGGALLDVRFVPETGVSDGHGYSGADTGQLVVGVNKLHDLLKELGGELGNAD